MSGTKGPVVHNNASSAEGYVYRSGMGMMPCAEFDVFHDDFHSFVVATAITNGPVANVPWGWQSAIIDTGSTVAVNETAALGRNGVLTIADASVSEGAAVLSNKSFQLTAGKRFFMEARVRTDDVTDSVIQFGLSSATVVTDPEDLWDTSADNILSFGIADGAATTVMYTDKSNAGPTTTTGSAKPMVVNTWHTLAIAFDGRFARGYLDGEQTLVTEVTVPTGVALAAFFAALNGNGAANGVYLFDYIRIVSER
jgi:hypothetical protein